MQYNNLGNLFKSSALALGGGGIGQVWGKTTREEAMATVEEACEAGINLLDLAPLYGNGEAESVVGTTFSNGYPADLHLTTKCMLGRDKNNIELRLTESLDQSCERLRKNYIDIFILHGFIIPDDWQPEKPHRFLARIGIDQTIYQQEVVPVFEKLKQSGRIGGWGITAASLQTCNLAALSAEQKPDAIQCISNVLNSPGSMAISDEVPDPEAVINAANHQGIGVMGIRAVAAGALTDAFDREVKPGSHETADFEAAREFRAQAAKLGQSTAQLAHHYALSMPGVDTVVLGVKNRHELRECIAAEGQARMHTEELRDARQSVIA